MDFIRFFGDASCFRGTSPGSRRRYRPDASRHARRNGTRAHASIDSGVDKPFYIEYRLLDLDVRNVTASFGALLSNSTSRQRVMSVDVRVGDYHLDSSNFVSEDGFQGFLGSTGFVGIDHDYNSLRQDLWLATDQAYKAAATQMSLKTGISAKPDQTAGD